MAGKASPPIHAPQNESALTLERLRRGLELVHQSKRLVYKSQCLIHTSNELRAENRGLRVGARLRTAQES